MTQESLTHTVTLSSNQVRAGLLSGPKWEGLPAACGMDVVSPGHCLVSAHHYVGHQRVSEIFFSVACVILTK